MRLQLRIRLAMHFCVERHAKKPCSISHVCIN